MAINSDKKRCIGDHESHVHLRISRNDIMMKTEICPVYVDRVNTGQAKPFSRIFHGLHGPIFVFHDFFKEKMSSYMNIWPYFHTFVGRILLHAFVMFFPDYLSSTFQFCCRIRDRDADFQG